MFWNFKNFQSEVPSKIASLKERQCAEGIDFLPWGKETLEERCQQVETRGKGKLERREGKDKR